MGNGWQCPVCGAVWAWWVAACSYHGPRAVGAAEATCTCLRTPTGMVATTLVCPLHWA